MSSVALPQPPQVVKKEDNRAVIEISGLSPGYGVTVGNSLRRVLYSSIPGAAITSAKIEGVSHEFSTMDGVLEDVLEIGMNLKQIKIVLHGDEPQTMKLKVKGKKECLHQVFPDITNIPTGALEDLPSYIKNQCSKEPLEQTEGCENVAGWLE